MTYHSSHVMERIDLFARLQRLSMALPGAYSFPRHQTPRLGNFEYMCEELTMPCKVCVTEAAASEWLPY
jgi:hypothetical protein